MTDIALEVGADPEARRVIVKMGAVYTSVEPATARAAAIALIHAAEVAGLGPQPKPEPPKTKLKLVA